MSVRRRGSGRENSDGDLYFEMEFPAREEDNVSFSSRSIESFGSETGPDSRQSPFREAASRESSCGPPRPSSLAIPGITALPTFSRFKRDAQYGSLPRAKTQHKVPRIQCGNFSVPTTPADSWGDKPDFLRQRDLSSSVSSVEEATEATAPATKSKSRLSLNLGVWGDSASLGPGSPVRSPRFLPRFLRSSFSKLLQGGKTRTPEPDPLPSLPHLSSILSRSRCATPEEASPSPSPPSTPTTQTFVQESLARGLPIIPFPSPTFVILEKKRAGPRPTTTSSVSLRTPRTSSSSISTRPLSSSSAPRPPSSSSVPRPPQSCSSLRAPSSSSCTRAQPLSPPLPGPQLNSSGEPKHKRQTVSAPTSRKSSSRVTPPGSLAESVCSLVHRARMEMEREASVRKPSWIRGYASNNSRALMRRRSSVTEYVREGEGCQEARRATKSLSQQENMAHIQEEKLDQQQEDPVSLDRLGLGPPRQEIAPYLDMQCGKASKLPIVT